ncbi:MAG: hypothetical protein ABIH52_04465 [Candidatus Aenigmatarchaeota archaeon]
MNQIAMALFGIGDLEKDVHIRLKHDFIPSGPDGDGKRHIIWRTNSIGQYDVSGRLIALHSRPTYNTLEILRIDGYPILVGLNQIEHRYT